MTRLRRIQLSLLTPVFLLAQNPGTGTGTSGGTTGGTTTPGTTTSRPATTSAPSLGQPQAIPEQIRPVFLAGRVQLAEGGGPGERVAIERVCNGRPHIESYTDSKGHFSFQLGSQQSMQFADATESSSSAGFGQQRTMGSNPAGQYGEGISERQLLNCEIRASLPGYRSDVIMLANRKFMDNPDVGIIVLHRMSNVQGLTTSGTTALAPKDARKAFDRGMDYAKKSKFDESQRELEKAVDIYPKYASAWYELGRVEEARQKTDAAKTAYQKALEADGKFLKPYEGLYLIAAHDKKWQEVADLTEKVVKLNPYDFPGAYALNAMANLNMQKPGPAEISIREAIKLDTQERSPRNKYMLGLILAQKQDFEAALPLLRTYLEGLETSARFDGNFAAVREAELVKKQLADIERFASAKAGVPRN